MARKLGTAINNNFNNSLLTLASRLAAGNNGNEDFFSGDLATIFNLFAAAVAGPITTTTTLLGPLPHTIYLAPSGPDQVITFMPLTAANHARLGDPIRIINLGNFTAQLRYSDNNPIPGSAINPGNVKDYIIRTVGTPGVLEVAGLFGTICNQDSPLLVGQGGTGATTAEDARTNLGLDYESGVHNTNWINPWEFPQVGNISYTRLNKTVSLIIPTVGETAFTADIIAMETPLPVNLRPVEDVHIPLRVFDSGLGKIGLAIIDTNGFITIFSSAGQDAFGATNTAGFFRCPLIYDVP